MQYAVISLGFTNPLSPLLILNIYDFYSIWAAVMPFYFSWSYVCHAEVNAILNTNHASAAGQVNSLSLSVCVSFLATICMFCVCELATFFSTRSIKANTKTLCFSITFAYLLQLILLLQHVLKYILVSELISLHSHSAEALRHNVPMQWMCQDYHSGKVSTLARCWEH